MYNSNITEGDKMAEIVVKKWGNSLGIIIPNEIVKQKQLEEGDVVFIPDIMKKADLTPVYGSIKRKMSGQAFKDMVREGWK